MIAIAPVVLSSLSFGARPIVRRSTLTMGSLLDIQIVTPNADHANRVIRSVFEEFYRLHNLLSVYRSESWISRINRHAGRGDIVVPDEVTRVLTMAKEFHRNTNGRFNVLVEPLMRVFGFRNMSPTHSEKDVADALEAAKPHHLVLSRTSAGLTHEQAAIDLGGIGVGYALDRSVEILRSEGIDNALLNHSGDIYALGDGPDGAGWRVSIQDPIDLRGSVVTHKLRDTAISTSGNYQQVSRFNGQTRGHILQTEDGSNPHFYLSLSVVADTATEADALSTGYFCSPHIPNGVRFIALIPNEAGYIVQDRL